MQKVENWYFTFMQRQHGLQDKYVKIKGSYQHAREEMCRRYGNEWAFQYNEEDFIPQIKDYGLEELK